NGAHILVPIVFATDDDGLSPPEICVDAIGGTGTAASPAAFRPSGTGEAFFMPAMGCPDLVLPVQIGATLATLFVPHTGTAGTCGVDMASALAMTIGVPLTAVTANGATALVTSSGVYSIANPTQCKTQPSSCLLTAATRTWEFASTGDFDGDGRQDFATGGQNEDVEIWMQQAAIGGKAQWLDRRLPTSGTAEILVTGDFDGDGFDDLAIASVDPVADRTAQIAMAYGGPTGELDGPIAAGTFVEFDSLAMAPLVDPSQPAGLDHADDLIIANGGDLNSTIDAKLTYIYGAGSRLPSAPWGYESTFGGSQSEHTAGWAAAIGRYGTNHTPGAFAAFTQSAGVQVVPGHDGVVVELTRTPDTFVPSTDKPIDSCETNASFCAATAHYVSVPRDDGDLLLAFGAAADTADCGAYDVAAGGVPALTTIACSSLAPGADAEAIKSITGITSATVIDDSTIAIAKLPRDGNDTLWLWTVAVVGGAPQLTQPIDLSAEIKKAMGLSEAHCMDATAIDLGTRTVDGASYGDGHEIVVSCRVPVASGLSTWLYARFTGAAGSLIVPLLDVGADTFTDVEAGDV
ncbi:MAG TPA: FG-GAP-like repeat-containing protein, partial [Kofleriaceae bacterium]|nr:FG-GAP-like repeat-containing protein [Kofleriaceae bacterium]